MQSLFKDCKVSGRTVRKDYARSKELTLSMILLLNIFEIFV